MIRLRNYFIGDFLKGTDDVFEQARITLMYRFCVMFFILFLIPLATDISLGLHKALILHGFDAIMILIFPFLFRKWKNLDASINVFFLIIFITTAAAMAMLNSTKMNTVGVVWNMFFILLSALLQRGISRILFCFFFGWLPMTYATLNGYLDGAMTLDWIVQAGVEDPPEFLVTIPILLGTYAIWSHTDTIQKAKNTITDQKILLEEKNKSITDSIQYASRIQKSLLPTDKYVEKNINRMKGK